MKSFMIKCSRLRFLLILTLVMAVCAIAVAENEGTPEQKEVLTTLEQRMLKKISVDFRNTPIEDVIRIMGDQAEVDIVTSPKVTGKVTATLTNVPLEEALNNILAAHGFGYTATKNMIRVAPLDEVTAVSERLVHRIYRITYADITEVEATLNRFISKSGVVSSNPGTSNVIVTDTESKIEAIDRFITEIDRITPQILVEARIYDITSDETLDLGVEWQAGRGAKYTSGGTETYGTSSGVTTVGPNPTADSDHDPFLTGIFSGATGKTSSSTSGALRLGWLNAGIDIDTVLKAQEEIIQAKLLANPRVLVLDNEDALFDIVREIPYKEQTSTASTTTQAVQFKKVGVKLEVTPHVTRDGMIRLHIVPEFGVVVGTYSEGSAPTVDTRKLDTKTLVRDGQTVVLGGLRKKDVAQQINKIPLLGDLPMVGWLFRFEGEDTVTSEIVVFITPRIVEQPVLSETEQRQFKATEFPGPEPTLTRAEKAAEEE